MFTKILTILLLSTFETYAAIAAGVAFGLSPLTICIATITGGVAGVYITAYMGDKIKKLIEKYRPAKAKAESGKHQFIKKLWRRYGVFGVGFIGTFLVGAVISIGVGLGFNVTRKPLMMWCVAAIVCRCIAYSYFFDYLSDLF